MVVRIVSFGIVDDEQIITVRSLIEELAACVVLLFLFLLACSDVM
jgi:hypothetical protein